MASLEEALAAKTLELETLQRSFDEYLESSKDLESELEKSLADAEAKLATSENKRRTAEEKLKALQDQCSYYEKASNSTNDELAKLREKVELLEKQKVKNEIENEDLSNQLRVLESNEESMREKINKLEEEVILANSETENVALASKDNERRLLDRIEELVSLTSANHASSEPTEEGKVENAKALAVPPVEAVEVASPATITIGSLTPKPPAEILPQERGRIFEDDFVVKRKITDALATADAETIRGELLNMWNKYEALKSHNIKLLYKIQSLRGNIQVCCRTRPPLDHELRAGGQLIVDASDDSELLCFDSKTEFWKPFVFDRVWSVDATQTDVFLDMEPLVLAVLDGYNSCIMAYGQTGSGKTFTMEGSNVQLGVNYRAVLQIFEVLESRRVAAETMRKKMQQAGAKASNGKTPSKAVAAAPVVVEEETAASAAGGDADESVVQEAVVSVLDDPDVDAFRYKIEISMLEIYNEQVFDLLVDDRAQSEASALDIRQAPDGGITVPGLRQTEVRNAEEAIAVFQRGSRNRATASTNLNEHSSRSHLVIQIDVTVAPPGESSVRGRLLLVDLAGSERVSKSGVTGTAMKEAQFINKSLLALGDVMEALDQKQKYVPYRNSKLTFLLQNALGGNSKTALIVTLCPTDANADETLFTLHFASRVRNISLGAAAKYSNSKNLEVAVKNLRIEVKELRRKKALVEEALVEAKKDAKKATDKSFSLQDTKLKSLEENKRAAELLVQQLSKQLHDANHKYGEEHARVEKLLGEADLTQKNLRRALEQIKELQQEMERVSQALHSKERELESVQAALLRALADRETRGEASAADGERHHVVVASSSPRQSMSPQRQEKVRVSFTFNEFGGTADVPKDNGRAVSATKPVNPRLLALTTDTASSKAKIQSPRGSNGAPSPARRESFPLSKASSLLRTPTTPSTTTASSAVKNRDASANRLVRSTTAKEQVTPSTATRKSIGSSALLRTPTTPAPSSTTSHHAHTPATATPATRSSNSRSLTPTMIPKRSSPAPVHTPSTAPASSAEPRTGSLQKDRPKVERSLTPTYVPFSSPSAADIVIRDAATSSLHAATRQALSATSGDLSKRVVSMNNRTEDALRRHQERMGKRREASSTH